MLKAMFPPPMRTTSATEELPTPLALVKKENHPNAAAPLPEANPKRLVPSKQI
jgi:hypothetical protein